jgi:exopolysaccharide biosynthesis polyprenyl glycosylphosphotransferase
MHSGATRRLRRPAIHSSFTTGEEISVTTIRRQLLVNAFKLFDLCAMIVCFGVATLAVSETSQTGSLAEFLSLRVKISNFLIFALFLVSWHVIFSSFRLYASHRLSRRRDEMLDILKACSLGTFMVLVAAVLFRIRMATPMFLVILWATSALVTVASRMALRSVLKRLRIYGRNLRNMLIIGTNQRALDFAKRIDSRPALGYRIVGFVDEPWSGVSDFLKTGYSLSCDFAGLPALLRSTVIDEVVLALPVRSLHSRASEIATLCEEQGIVVRLFDVFDLKASRSRAEEFEGHPVITHYRGSLDSWAGVIKRGIDFILSLLALAFVSPVLLICTVLIKLTSRGPVLFVQKRLGLNKRHFNVYKFRTMGIDAEKRLSELEHLNEVSGPVFKIKNDPRITPLGRFLRKTSIDELPQLLNVLKGDMSLVGPRPLPVRDYEGFSKDWQRRRFSVRPGITCLWQIKGRSSIPFEQWMELDLQYIDKWSLWLDLEILLRTIPAVLKGSGAA